MSNNADVVVALVSENRLNCEMVIRISTEQLNVNDIMNNEPPLILISKQLLIGYYHLKQGGNKGKKGNWKHGKGGQARKMGQWGKEKHNRSNIST